MIKCVRSCYGRTESFERIQMDVNQIKDPPHCPIKLGVKSWPRPGWEPDVAAVWVSNL